MGPMTVLVLQSCRNRPNHHGGIETGNVLQGAKLDGLEGVEIDLITTEGLRQYLFLSVLQNIYDCGRNRPNHHGGIETFYGHQRRICIDVY